MAQFVDRGPHLGIADGSATAWDFTIIDGHSTMGFPVLIAAHSSEKDHITVEAPGLYGHRSAAYEQLDQGLRALGFTPHLQN